MTGFIEDPSRVWTVDPCSESDLATALAFRPDFGLTLTIRSLLGRTEKSRACPNCSEKTASALMPRTSWTLHAPYSAKACPRPVPTNRTDPFFDSLTL